MTKRIYANPEARKECHRILRKARPMLRALNLHAVIDPEKARMINFKRIVKKGPGA